MLQVNLAQGAPAQLRGCLEDGGGWGHDGGLSGERGVAPDKPEVSKLECCVCCTHQTVHYTVYVSELIHVAPEQDREEGGGEEGREQGGEVGRG